jgi:phosphohistidine phosphatase
VREAREMSGMDVYLMQHGEATTEAENPDRPLTEAGRAAVQRVSARAGAVGVHVGVCVHSGKLRAEQTAQLLMEHVGDRADVSARQGLGPKDDVAPTAQWLRTTTEQDAIAVIGHLPFLDRLASLLVAGDEEAHVVRFQMGALVRLEPDDEGEGFAVGWVLPPGLA